MKKLFAALVIVLFVLGSCIKNDRKCSFSDSTLIAPDTEQAALQDSLTAHGYSASLHPSGFYYTINSQGSGKFISNLCSVVSVEYKASFFNGKIFDSTKTGDVANFVLGRVIQGWQKGMSLISQGGNITLYIPPSLGYGPSPVTDQNTGIVLIPENSYLIFNVHLVDVQ